MLCIADKVQARSLGGYSCGHQGSPAGMRHETPIAGVGSVEDRQETVGQHDQDAAADKTQQVMYHCYACLWLRF